MRSARRHRGRNGFSLVELVIAMAVLMVVAMAGLTLVDAGQRVASSQTGIAELQNNQRVAQQELARMVSMAGVGGLPESIDPSLAGSDTGGVFPDGLALAIDNDVPPNTHVGGLATPRVIEGSDILTVRGVYSTPALFIEPQVPLVLDEDGRVSLVVGSAVDVGVNQDLEAVRRELEAAAGATRPEAFIVRDRFNPGAFAVLELDPASTVPGDPGDPTLTVGLILSSNSGLQQFADEYGRMILGTSLLQGSGGEQATLPDGTVVQLPRMIGSVGLLEEHRFYVREEREVSADAGSRLAPVLARMRFYPGTDVAHPDGSIDVAGDVIDLQAAAGVDLPPADGQIAAGVDADGLDVTWDLDEVLYNHPGDDDGLSPPAGSRAWAVPAAKIGFVRVTTVAQAARPDRNFEGIGLGTIEDHDLSASIFNQETDLKVRKRSLSTVVELRNLP